MNSTPGGNSTLGTISSAGLYTAPHTVPPTGSVMVQAISVQDNQISGSAKANVWLDISSVTVSPAIGNVKPGETLQFTATVQGAGSFNSAVNWSVNGVPGGDGTFGTITRSGLYAAPSGTPPGTLVPVEATSVAESQLSGSAQAYVSPGPPPAPKIQNLSPATANAGDQIQVNGTNLYAPGDTVTAVFPGPNGVPLPVVVYIDTATATQLQLIVPLGTVSGPVYIQVQPFNFPTQNSNSVALMRLPRVRIRAPQKDLSQGESTNFQSRILAGTGSETLTWTVDVGSVTSNGTYSAPASVPSDTFAVVTTCITGTQICDQERLGLHPFRITPAVPIVPLGGNIQLQAIQAGAPINASWQLNGPGSLQQNGMYTASVQPAEGGGIPITATYSGVQEQVSVSVTGGFNGLVNRVSDYIDELQQPVPLGTRAADVGVVGNRAYVLATNQIDLPIDNPYYWEDVYDLTDPLNPVWIDAFEPVTRGHFLSCDGYTYEITGGDYSQGPPYPGVIAVYDTSGSSPVLLSKQISDTSTAFLMSESGCLFTEVSEYSTHEIPLSVDLFNLNNGAVIHTQYTIALPGNNQEYLAGVASDGNRVFVRTTDPTNPELFVYDLSTTPAALVSSLQAPAESVFGLSIVGSLLFETNDPDFHPESQIYDITSTQPTLLGPLDVGQVLSSSGTNVLTGLINAGLQLVNVSNPQQPLITGTLFDFMDSYSTAVLFGSQVYQSEDDGGLAIYDASIGGGLPQLYLTVPISSPVTFGPAFGQTATSSTLYFAIADPELPGILSFDLTAQPPSYLGSFSTGTSLAQSLALSGNNLYVGTTESLTVLDVTNPATPTQIGSVNQPVLSLAVSGNSLFAGTGDDRLIVFDITQPASPTQKASLSLSDQPYQMAISGNLLLVADVSGGLLVYNIAVPASPQLISQVKPSMGVFDIGVDGNLALLAAWDAGLVIVDLTNPSQPKVVGQAGLGTDLPYASQSVLLNKAFTITVLNKVAYVGVLNFDPNENNGEASIYGFDYTTPSSPRLVHLDVHSNTESDGIITLRAVGSKLIATSALPLLLELDASLPQNAINLFYLPSSLTAPPTIGQLPVGSIRVRKLPRKRSSSRGTPGAP